MAHAALPAGLRLFMALYRLIWYPALPLVMLYFLMRGRKDRAYLRHMGERFGGGAGPVGAVWVHAVSLGEMRSAVPLVRALLDRGDCVVTTHLTPAGRRAAETAFATEIAEGRLAACYLPLEFGWAYRRFFRRLRPRLGLVLEIEVWPVMILAARKAGVPLFLANSQYPARSFARDRRLAHWLGHPVRALAGVLAKSETHAARFAALGAPNIHVCGELRFDQPIPPALPAAAEALSRAHPALARRGVVTLASVVEGEDDHYLTAYRHVQSELRRQGLQPPLFIHVPRAPERFSAVGDLLEAAGQNVLRRSRAFDAQLGPRPGAFDPDADILLGDSLGEMYFYLALADVVVVGGGFVKKGAHNVIEPLALRKPVLVGPHVWTIEYPGIEAQAAQVMKVCPEIPDLAAELLDLLQNRHKLDAMADRTDSFFAEHAGATRRSLAVIDPLLGPRHD
ncbi:3-deoxy-D-manno-octulosonic acid transferase [Plastorhodobacter daqingensis]|uniref:3-deoxy-D-manno-octulosonic acid transferase n=1 Tax=Plastorhodobacter daqingensis TaxID=1387281 RepID=A0ABW2UDU1_9RHOB